MHIDSDYKTLGTFPINVIQPLIDLANELDWSLPDFSRNGHYLDNAIVRVPYNIRKEPPQEITPTIQRVLDCFWPIDAYMRTLYPDHVFIKCEMNWIKPNENIPIHIDPCWWHGVSHRIHVPIITNDDCFFLVEGRPHHFEVGKYYEVNNRKYHSVSNTGTHGRLHLVFDAMPQTVYNDAIAQSIDISEVNVTPYKLDSFENLPKDLLL